MSVENVDNIKSRALQHERIALTAYGIAEDIIYRSDEILLHRIYSFFKFKLNSRPEKEFVDLLNNSIKNHGSLENETQGVFGTTHRRTAGDVLLVLQENYKGTNAELDGFIRFFEQENVRDSLR